MRAWITWTTPAAIAEQARADGLPEPVAPVATVPSAPEAVKAPLARPRASQIDEAQPSLFGVMEEAGFTDT